MNQTKHERAVTGFGGCQTSLLGLAATKSTFIIRDTVLSISKKDGLNGWTCEKELKARKEFEMPVTGDLKTNCLFPWLYSSFK